MEEYLEMVAVAALGLFAAYVMVVYSIVIWG